MFQELRKPQVLTFPLLLMNESGKCNGCWMSECVYQFGSVSVWEYLCASICMRSRQAANEWGGLLLSLAYEWSERRIDLARPLSSYIVSASGIWHCTFAICQLQQQVDTSRATLAHWNAKFIDSTRSQTGHRRHEVRVQLAGRTREPAPKASLTLFVNLQTRSSRISPPSWQNNILDLARG